MTLVLGVEYGGRTVLAGDGAISYLDGEGCSTGSASSSRLPKVFRRGGVVIGAAGSLRAISVLRYDLALPPLPARLDALDRWAGSDVAGAIRTTLLARGISLEDSGVEVLVGTRGRLYAFDDELGCDRPREGFTAIGSGEDCGWVALGLQRERSTAEPERQLRRALKWTSKRRVDVGPPFRVVST